jgi:hypothetical protein
MEATTRIELVHTVLQLLRLMPATLVGQLGSKTGSKTKPVSVNRRALILWAINRFQMPASHFAVLMAITAKIEPISASTENRQRPSGNKHPRRIRATR